MGSDVRLNRGQGGVVILQGPRDQIAALAQESAHRVGGVIVINGKASRLTVARLIGLWPTAHCASIALGAYLFVVLLQSHAVSIPQNLSIGLIYAAVFGIVLASRRAVAFLARLPGAAAVGVAIEPVSLLMDLALAAGEVLKRSQFFRIHHGSQHTPPFVSPLTPIMVLDQLRKRG